MTDTHPIQGECHIVGSRHSPPPRSRCRTDRCVRSASCPRDGSAGTYRSGRSAPSPPLGQVKVVSASASSVLTDTHPIQGALAVLQCLTETYPTHVDRNSPYPLTLPTNLPCHSLQMGTLSLTADGCGRRRQMGAAGAAGDASRWVRPVRPACATCGGTDPAGAVGIHTHTHAQIRCTLRIPGSFAADNNNIILMH